MPWPPGALGCLLYVQGVAESCPLTPEFEKTVGKGAGASMQSRKGPVLVAGVREFKVSRL